MSSAQPAAAHEQRKRAIRSGLVYCCLPALLTAFYAAATGDRPGRPALLMVVVAVLLTAGLAALTGRQLLDSRWWAVPQHLGAFGNLAGYVAFALLDGGVAGPLGIFIPTSTMLLATVMLPRAFLGMAALNAIGYGVVVVYGDPGPPGYWMVHGLAFGAAAVLCLRHSMVLASLRRRLSATSRTDPLTGCLNRRGFDQRLAEELAGSDRTGRPVTLVLLDLDHFKQVNDEHGHRAGDDLLTWLGLELRAEAGVAGRLGGDEFALLLTGADAAAAARVVERLRDRLPSSFGTATYPAEARDGEGLATVADRRLYADKAARERRAPSAGDLAAARARIGDSRPQRAKAPARDRRRHTIANPGWMAVAQTSVAMVYLALFTAGHPYRSPMLAICLWGFATGLTVVLTAGRISRARRARPLMLTFCVSSFVSCAIIALLDGGVDSPLGVGILIAFPLLMLGMRAQIAVPVALSGGVLYVAVALIGGTDLWYAVVSLISTAAISAACAIQGRSAARQRRMLTRLSSIDVLTEVFNRRGFGGRFTADLDRIRSSRSGAALLVADLDGFKQLNDAYGHAAGDELLRWVAATLRERVQSDDLVGRLGGDEFVIMLHGDRTGMAEQARTTAEKLVAALGERTAVSIGVAVLGTDGDDFDSLYTAADARLYQEKVARRARDEITRERETLRG